MTTPPPSPVREPSKPAATDAPASIEESAQVVMTRSYRPAMGSATRQGFVLPLLRRDTMLDTDLEGLGPKEAAEYVLAFITTLKQTEKALEAAQEDTNVWTRRVSLAQGKADAGLAAQATARLSDALAKQSKLEAELGDLKAKVSVLKEKLTRIRMAGVKLVDVDLLLAQLQMAAGKKDDLARTMKQEEAGAALDELKKKMQGQN
jgi:hypothetical protein